MFFGLLAYVLVFGGQAQYIVETGIASLGTVVQNLFELATYTDPLRTTSFPQNWTIFYWSYWMVWCVASPFFIGTISRGHPIRQTILGGYIFGIADFIGQFEQTSDLYTITIDIINTLPWAPAILTLVLFTMMAFYATSFDAIALIASFYRYKKLEKINYLIN